MAMARDPNHTSANTPNEKKQWGLFRRAPRGAIPPKGVEEDVAYLAPTLRSGGFVGAVRPYVTQEMQREAHGFLARELRLVVERGYPVDGALEMLSLPEGEPRRKFWNLGVVFLFLLAVIFGLVGGAGWVIGFLALVIFVFLVMGGHVESDDYRRYVARTLWNEVRRGRTLGAAYRAHPELFTSFETELVEAGEQSGRMKESLEALGRHAYASDRLRHTFSMALYPLLLAVVIYLIALFFMIKIFPRYIDIYNQVGMELPALSSFILFLHRFNLLHVFAMGFLVLLFLPRWFFVGSSKAGTAFIALMTVTAGIVLYTILYPDKHHVLQSFWGDNPFALGVFCLLVGLGFSYGLFRLGRWLMSRGGERLMEYLTFVPGLRRAHRLLCESRFLMALHVLLMAGVEWTEALKRAGGTAPSRRWKHALIGASLYARQGHSPAEVFASLHRLFLPETLVALAVADTPEVLHETLLRTAEENERLGRQALSRFFAVLFPLIHVGEAVLVGFFLYLCYLPIFFTWKGLV
jgi:type II secretory pathway component PulF